MASWCKGNNLKGVEKLQSDKSHALHLNHRHLQSVFGESEFLTDFDIYCTAVWLYFVSRGHVFLCPLLMSCQLLFISTCSPQACSLWLQISFLQPPISWPGVPLCPCLYLVPYVHWVCVGSLLLPWPSLTPLPHSHRCWGFCFSFFTLFPVFIQYFLFLSYRWFSLVINPLSTLVPDLLVVRNLLPPTPLRKPTSRTNTFGFHW